GRSLVYQSYCPESFDDFYAIRPDGTGLRRLTHTPVLKGNPAWSPDGTRIAFSRCQRMGDSSCNGPGSEIWVVDGSGSHPRPLSRSGPDGGRVVRVTFDADPSWSSDGRRVIFSR